MKRVIAMWIGFLAAGSPAAAFVYGNPGKALSEGATSLEGVLDLGKRRLEVDGGGLGDATINGIYATLRRGLGQGVEVSGRLIPLTQEWDFDDSNYSPRVFGLGAGIHWVPAGQSGPLTWGLGGALDWGTGSDNGRDLDYLDVALNGGVGYALDERLDVYGGLSFVQSDVTVETGGGDIDLEYDNPIGLFGGVAYKAGPDWTLGAELRLVNETVLGLTARYGFGGPSRPRRK